MTYQEATQYLFESAPLFQNVGKDAYKEGLSTTHILDEHFQHPHTHYRTIHVGGTNGKGSCSHTLAAILQAAGYRVGLYTSPHLVDFRERIRINGICIPEERVIRFVEEERYFFEPLHPSFFELTTALAFQYFAEEKVDVAVIEVGLGGRLDCTNIITPVLSVITNISKDHVQFLGDTLEKIAFEKAGIIKPHIPAVIGETVPETRKVFEDKAREVEAPIYFAEDIKPLQDASRQDDGKWSYQSEAWGTWTGELAGDCQVKNTNTILTALPLLQKHFKISTENIHEGFGKVCESTGLRGRWQILKNNPLTVCDTGHNVGGITYIVEQLNRLEAPKKHIVFGMVNDKDIESVLSLLPTDAIYYFTQASVKRALSAEKLQEKAARHYLEGACFNSVTDAYRAACANADEKDVIFIGGSTFVVADLLASLF